MLGVITREQFLRLAAGEIEIPLYDQAEEAERGADGRPSRPVSYVVLSATDQVRDVIRLLLDTPAITLRDAG